MKILKTIYEFRVKDTGDTNGLYHVELDSGDKRYFLRNNNSVGTITHYVGKPASECISIIRNDRKEELFKLLGDIKKEAKNG